MAFFVKWNQKIIKFLKISKIKKAEKQLNFSAFDMI